MKKTTKEKEIIPGCEEKFLKGNGIGCLLIHGFRSCPYEMQDYSKYLNDEGFTVQTVLLPGHGTDPSDMLNIVWQDWFNAVEEAFRKLKQKCNKVFIAGLSTGASLALFLATKQNLDGVICLAPGLYLKQRYAVLAHILKYAWKYKNIKSGPDILLKTDFRVYNKVPVKSVSELLKLYNSLKSKLKLIKTPCLIIYAVNDHVVLSKSAFTIFKKISSEHKRIIKLDKSYHILTMDVEKNTVFKETVNFINQITSKSQA